MNSLSDFIALFAICWFLAWAIPQANPELYKRAERWLNDLPAIVSVPILLVLTTCLFATGLFIAFWAANYPPPG